MSDDEHTPAPSPHVPWAFNATVERYHREDGLWKQEKGTKIQEHGFEINSIKDRLNNGAQSFTKMDVRIKAIEDAKNPQWKTVLTLFLIASPWVWVLAQYPNGEKFEGLQEKVRAMEVRQMETSRDIKDTQKQQDRMDAKLDQLLLKLGTGP